MTHPYYSEERVQSYKDVVLDVEYVKAKCESMLLEYAGILECMNSQVAKRVLDLQYISHAIRGLIDLFHATAYDQTTLEQIDRLRQSFDDIACVSGNFVNGASFPKDV